MAASFPSLPPRPEPCVLVSKCPSSNKDMGHIAFRTHSNARWYRHTFIIAADALFPNKVTFTGSGWTWVLWEQGSIQHKPTVRSIFYAYEQNKTNKNTSKTMLTLALDNERWYFLVSYFSVFKSLSQDSKLSPITCDYQSLKTLSKINSICHLNILILL